jgi:hypothetical protein
MAARRKKSRKKSARKTGRKKAGRKKAARKKSAAQQLLGSQLPRSLKALTAQMRRDLGRIERQLQTAGRGTRASLARVLRDASHQLGILEARGQQEWNKRSARAQREVQKTLARMRRALPKT